MIDVFFCTMYRPNSVRAKMRDLCLARWRDEPGILLFNLMGKDAGFQRRRRITADNDAEGKIYIVADDDCLLVANRHAHCIETAVNILKSRPEFSILSLHPTNANIVAWTPADGYKPHVDGLVEEHHSVGGIRVCRKGHMTNWPPHDKRPGYDQVHCDAIREAGGHVGFITAIRMNHLGEGYTTLPLRRTK